MLKFLKPYLLPASWYYTNDMAVVTPVYIRERDSDGDYAIVIYDDDYTNIINEFAWIEEERFIDDTPKNRLEVQTELEEIQGVLNDWNED